MRLNLGCGRKKVDGFINADVQFDVHPDAVIDITDGLPFRDSSVEMVLAYDLLEHIPIGKTVHVIEEIWRVLVPGGTFEHLTPSTDGRGAFQDPFHVSFWNLNSWLYYMDDEHRELYGIKAKFRGNLWNVQTNPERRIIHVQGILKAVK